MANTSSIQDGLIFGVVFNGKGGGKELSLEEIHQWKPTDGTLWLHLDRTNPSIQKWVEEDSHIDPAVCDALIAEDTRPRVTVFNEGMLLLLRGVNLNDNADPEDMITLRMWCTPKIIISLRKFKFKTVRDIRNELNAGKGPNDAGEFVSRLVEGLVDRIEVIVEKINDELDALEERVEHQQDQHDRKALGTIRRRTVTIRRYLVPQRDVLNHLHVSGVTWLNSDDLTWFREAADQMTRIVEDLDLLHERALVAKDLLETYLSEKMNKTMYWLTIVAAIFLPLGLLTGLLGINVGGIPLAENPRGFELVCGLLVLLFIGQICVFRWLKLY